MRIGIYIDVAKEEQPSGIGFHISNLIKALAEIDQKNHYLLYYQCGLTEYLPNLSWMPEKPNFMLRPIRFPNKWKLHHPTLWWKWYLPIILHKDKIDIFHGPNYFLPKFDHGKSIVTIHDLAFFHIKLYDGKYGVMLKDWTQAAIKQAAAIIALSQNTRLDLETLGVEPDRIHVIYGGGNIIPEDQICYDRVDELKHTLNLPDKYILFVGTLDERKNAPFLIRSFAKLKQRTHLPHSLVLVGQRSHATQSIERVIHELNIEADVIITGYIEEWKLPLLYKLSDLFVLPTLYEGFTLVTLEAMAYGVPVIATDTSSIREGVGDAAILVKVNDIEELTKAIYSVLADQSLRNRMIKSGIVQASKFTWDCCALQTLALYQKIYQKSDKSQKVFDQEKLSILS